MNLSIIFPSFHPCPEAGPVIATAADAAEFWKARVAGAPEFMSDKEWAVLAFVDEDNRLLGHTASSNGARDWVEFDPRDALLGAAVTNAPRVWAIHNHPAGASLSPSPQDHKNSFGVGYFLERMNARLVDYCVMAPDGSAVLSFREKGFMEDLGAKAEETHTEILEIQLRGVLGAIQQQWPVMSALLSDEAAATEQTEEAYLLALLSDALRERFQPPPVEHRWTWFAADVFRAAGDKQLTMLERVSGQARAKGISIIELLRRKAIPALVAEFTRPVTAEKNLGAPVDASAPLSS